ncbi:MAG: hypothetical protein JOS17DRAFT_746514 [Linnemannia elongata]|nr:MAG: hypothetical protein JOS17DRAFT_746514 [Linnemannia elongata]
MESLTATLIIAISGGFIIVGGLAFYFYKKEQEKSRAPISPDHPAFKNHDISANFFTHTQQPGHNGGVNYHQQLGSNNPPTVILPMAPLAPQQQRFMQDQMQGLQFSTHPRATFVTTAQGGEPGTHSSTNPYPETAGTPQTQWQPTPFVPPGTNQRIRAPEQDRSTPPLSRFEAPLPPIPHSPRATPALESTSIPPTIHHPHTIYTPLPKK